MICFCLTAGAYAQDAAAGLSEAQKKFQAELTAFLKEEGFIPLADGNDGSIEFKREGILHRIQIRGESPFFVVTGRDGYDLSGKNASERACALQAGNETGLTHESVKIVCTESAAQIKVEQYTRSAEDFKYVFYSNLRTLSRAREEFLRLYDRCITTVPGKQEQAVPTQRPINELERMRMQSPAIHDRYLAGHRMARNGRIFIISGSVMTVAGIAILATDNDDAITVGSICAGGGVGFIIGGSINAVRGGARKRRALQEFRHSATGERTEEAPHFQFNLAGNGIRLAYVF
ncbi:MAG: hypothetical protein LBJ01_08340 [Tannerella sp.]|jgi:hypothetical protein|nr:hypothetical protein [Tannerella sp.]